MSEKMKYVRLKRYNEIVIFPCAVDHSTFVSLDCVSAGFLSIGKNDVKCYGKSISLKMKSNAIEDSYYATRQVFGIEAGELLLTSGQ